VQLRKKIFILTFFYLTAYISLYAINYVLFRSLRITPNILNLFCVVLTVLFVIGLTTVLSFKLIAKECFSLSFLGLKKDHIMLSFILALTVSSPISILWLISVKVEGITKVLAIAKPEWIVLPISETAFTIALLFWILNGVIAFSLWEAFPLEILKSSSKLISVFFVVMMWAFLYNTPLLTSKFDIIDILIFGFAFTLVYSKTRNSLGIIFAYLLNENPLLWIIAASFFPHMEKVFLFLLIARFVICLAAIYFSVRFELLGRLSSG